MRGEKYFLQSRPQTDKLTKSYLCCSLLYGNDDLLQCCSKGITDGGSEGLQRTKYSMVSFVSLLNWLYSLFMVCSLIHLLSYCFPQSNPTQALHTECHLHPSCKICMVHVAAIHLLLLLPSLLLQPRHVLRCARDRPLACDLDPVCEVFDGAIARDVHVSVL